MSRCPSPSRATVDLSAIVANLALVRQRAGDRNVLFAVKADAYGHGAVAVAREVEATGAADWLAVATVAEGQELVEAGIGLPILKLSPADPWDLDAAVRAGLRLTVLDAETVGQVEEASARCGLHTRVHIGVDSGMGRIGLPPERLGEVVAAVDHSAHLDLEGVFTHLPISDVPTGRAFTIVQIGRFLGAVETVQKDRGPIPQVHMANSGAILGHDLTGTTMVRAGIVGYGYDPDPGGPNSQGIGLRPALSWTSHIFFLKTVEAGTTIGYGRTWTAPSRTVIATVPVGYADGYPRLLSSRGPVLIGGRRHLVAGRVCMDQIMVDLGPDADAAIGDEVVMIGSQGDAVVTADELAGLTGTISYEITCDISKRVDRVWVGGTA
ncbi:alanine racemase [Acidipropionibacterium jensenii]|uniref:Alanine racemase n=1 Tax=Acidipropionibacterium jensenii TaxID=1749 RepID=A0A3S5EV95_9ACTN|nr:alanine racemase [Acidipropionibacterium jensenii]MDN5977551.1 alanine racemase [Acidipropionibacterium jensenii]MDN5996939.1 alanine racemase [Acidipropionibacterium jensenii]MDN6426821.1 alanine racemase [Acidipropionibacterium jensenii]MDN6440877.1 alanine racemase [Acidipropionibacterium jensenii]MDN6480282.1 alanine racemase [Acidipropionibacterium jensenii]